MRGMAILAACTALRRLTGFEFGKTRFLVQTGAGKTADIPSLVTRAMFVPVGLEQLAQRQALPAKQEREAYPPGCKQPLGLFTTIHRKPHTVRRRALYRTLWVSLYIPPLWQCVTNGNTNGLSHEYS